VRQPSVSEQQRRAVDLEQAPLLARVLTLGAFGARRIDEEKFG